MGKDVVSSEEKINRYAKSKYVSNVYYDARV